MLYLSINQVKSLVMSALFLFSLTACSDFSERSETAAPADPEVSETEMASAEGIGELTLKPFANQEYHFSTEIPEGWVEATNQLEDGMPVINFIPESKVSATKLPVSMQTTTELSHIDIHPKGHKSGFPIGKSYRLAIYEGKVPASNMWDHDRSRVYVLGNGEEWAYLLYPKKTPAGWEEEGFIFAQIAIENFSSTCFDGITNQTKDMEACKPLEGDEVLYYGRLNAEEQQYVKHALQAFEVRI